MAKGKAPRMDYTEHDRTYSLFLQLSIATILSAALICVALVGMTIIAGAAFWWGLIGLVVGHVVIAATLMAGLSWLPGVAILIVTALLCVASI